MNGHLQSLQVPTQILQDLKQYLQILPGTDTDPAGSELVLVDPAGTNSDLAGFEAVLADPVGADPDPAGSEPVYLQILLLLNQSLQILQVRLRLCKI